MTSTKIHPTALTNEKPNKALVILSGGQDSTTCLFLAIDEFGVDNVEAITFDYGQRHSVEIEAAVKVSELAGIKKHHIVTIPHVLLSSSPLLSNNELEQYHNYFEMRCEVGTRVENTFVPMRNMFFLTIAVNHAKAYGCNKVYIGISGEDTANYPDCSGHFLRMFQETCDVALPKSVNIEAPLLKLTKAKAINLVLRLGTKAYEALAYTHTSYAGEYPPTDKNHANLLRARGFEEAGIPDPLILRAVSEGLMEMPTTQNYNVASSVVNFFTKKEVS